jgi:SAM-dependent methyltransferase
LLEELTPFFPLEGTECLHIGPGGFLGLEVLMYCLGANRICSIDKFTFGIDFPDITEHQEDYRRVIERFKTHTHGDEIRNKAIHRFADLFTERDDRILFDREKIEYLYPVDVCKLPFDDESFDLVLSFAVLEHVTDPEAAVAEMARSLKPGGLSLHTIVTQDHRSFSNIGGYTPFSFRSYEAEDWDRIAHRRFYQNRLLPVEWNHLFEESGLAIQKYRVEKRFELNERTIATFHPDFRRFPSSELGEVNCLIVAKKRFSPDGVTPAKT